MLNPTWVTSFRCPDRWLRTHAVPHRWYAEDILRIRDLWVLKPSAISPIDMLVRRGHSSCHGDTLTERRRPWGIYQSTCLGMTLHIRGRQRPAFPGTHSIPVRCTPDVNWCARNAVLSWLPVRLHTCLTRRCRSQRFWLTAYLAPGKIGLAQEGFICACNKCGFVVTREILGVSKFVCDLVKDPKNVNDVVQFRDAVYLP